MLHLIALQRRKIMNYKNTLVAKSLTEMGFKDFTDIQKQAIPLIEAGTDLIGHSQTGTGKTAAFTLPFLEKIDYNNPHVQALVICPTRELAVQVQTEIEKIGKYLPQLKTTAIYGGASMHRQIKALKRKPQIVVGTPGRLLDMTNRNLVKLKNLEYLVLDEADEMMKMGFKEDIEKIINQSNTNRQTVMFSATMPKQIVKLTKQYMTNPEMISVVSDEETNSDITQYYYQVQPKHKVDAVTRLLQVYQPKLTLIFCNTKRKVDQVTIALTQKGYNVNKIHGDLSQPSRMQVLESFHQGVLDILVATDVAARGLDIKNVEVVVNYDVPEKPEFYVHRIGRTGRIGNKGLALMMVSGRDKYRIKDIERFTKSSIKKRNIPTPEKIEHVTKQKKIETVTSTIEDKPLTKHQEMAMELLSKHEPVEVVSALLKMAADEIQTDQNHADLNAEFKGPKKHAPGQGETRYHFNIGRSDGLSPKELVDTIMKRTRLKNEQINNVIIAKRSSFFTGPSKKHNQIMKSLTNIKILNKKTSIQVAKERGGRRRRKRR